MRKVCVLPAVGVLVAACGHGGSQGSPTQPAAPTYSVTATVFYDENGNGQLDPSEAVRVPGVDVVIGDGTGRTAPNTGVAQVTGIHEGTFTVGVRTDSLPNYYQAMAGGTIQVPGGATDVRIPVTLPIGSNQPNVYFGYGDSITLGDGSSDRQGYGPKLQNLLAPYLGRAQVTWFGRSGTNSMEGAQRARTWIPRQHAAYVLVLYGTNDWQDQTCQNKGPDACFTIEALGDIVDVIQGDNSLAVVGTLLPANPAINPGRNTWIDQTNVKIKAFAQQRGILLADLNAEFKAASVPLSSLFYDDIHPNDAGYQVLAQGWFKAITRSRSAAASSQHRRGLFGGFGFFGR